MTNRTEPSVGSTSGLKGLFSNNKKLPQVKDILSGMTKLVDDLRSLAKQHEAKIAGNNVQIGKLQADIEVSQAEITAASNAERNLSSLLGLTNERPETKQPDTAA